ncbi:MAG: response regulator [Gammaproteobacteria bacterium]|nr:response regulator [Gammaproteobacteria bacterium]
MSQSRMLEEQAFVARQVSQAKSSLMAVATHDLRQPLHALNLLVETLESRTDNPRLRKLIGKIQYSITAVSDSFSTMQDIIRLDANKIVPEKGVVDLGSLSKQLCREFKEQAEEKGLLFTIDACEIHGQSDAVLLKRILHNLLSNAICYTDVGKVSMHCRSSAEEIQISVSDTGAGIAKEQQAHIFEEFYQTDTKNRNNEGIGLGLSIVKRLAALLSHPLSFDSHPGQGSTFIISIPPAASSSREIKESPAAWEWEEDAFIPGGYIVVMDSDPVTREVTVELLEDWGYEVLPADNPETVLQQLAASEKIPELIISGYNLQEKYTGIQAIQAVQQRLSKDVPAIIITAEMSTQNVSDMKQSGYPILLKPVRPDYLYEMIKKHLSRSVEQLV